HVLDRPDFFWTALSVGAWLDTLEARFASPSVPHVRLSQRQTITVSVASGMSGAKPGWRFGLLRESVRLAQWPESADTWRGQFAIHGPRNGPRVQRQLPQRLWGSCSCGERVPDSKSGPRKWVWVQVPPSAIKIYVKSCIG